MQSHKPLLFLLTAYRFSLFSQFLQVPSIIVVVVRSRLILVLPFAALKDRTACVVLRLASLLFSCLLIHTLLLPLCEGLGGDRGKSARKLVALRLEEVLQCKSLERRLVHEGLLCCSSCFGFA